jgi:hypothetical protein
MAIFTISGVLRGFAPAACEEAVCAEYDLYASTKTPARHRERSGEAGVLVRPCSSGAKHCPATKLLISELETYPVPNTCYVIYRWTGVKSDLA